MAFLEAIIDNKVALVLVILVIGQILFFTIRSLLSRWETQRAIKSLTEEREETQKVLKETLNRLKSRQTEFQKEIMDLQREIEKGLNDDQNTPGAGSAGRPAQPR